MNLFDTVEHKLAGYPLARDHTLALMRKGRRACTVRTGQAKMEHIQQSLAQLWRSHPKKTKILYLVHYPLPNIIRQSLALRQTGRYVTALIGACNREELRLEQYFDAHFECGEPIRMANGNAQFFNDQQSRYRKPNNKNARHIAEHKHQIEFIL